MINLVSTPDQVADFLAGYPPFNALAPEELLRIAESIEVIKCVAGMEVLTHADLAVACLYIIRQGSVDLRHEDAQDGPTVDTLGMGEYFCHPSLMHRHAPIVTARTCEATCLYCLPGELFLELCHDTPAFASFFADSALERLSYRLRSHYANADPVLFRLRLRDLIRRPLITVAPDVSVRQAAQIMCEHDISSLVVCSHPPGMLTDRDLRNRVLAPGLSDATPVAEVMSIPALTLPADSLVFEGLLTMLEKDMHQMPITEGEQVIGLVTRTDILRQRKHTPLFLPRRLQHAQDFAQLQAYSEQLVETVGTLLDSGARVSDIGRVVAVARDGLLTRLLQDAETALGMPPCPYDWLVLGSAGRYEQTPSADQDHALVYADDAPASAEAYFAELAGRVVEQLVACGLPRCPGNVMASNPQWCQPLAVWQRYFTDWIHLPDEEALLQVTIFFDFRSVYGNLGSTPVLRQIVQRAQEQRVFLGRLARAALRQSVPLSFFRQVVLERDAEGRSLLDLKHRGTALIVDLGRLFTLEAGCGATSTLERLRMASGNSMLSETGAEELAAAFELLSLLRLRHQYQQIQQGIQPDNLIPYAQLSPLEQRELKEALRLIARIQRSVALTFQTGRIA